MILKDIDFKEFFEHTRDIFSKHFSKEEVNQIMEYVEILADANFRCYRANMIVIDGRKLNKAAIVQSDFNLYKLIAEMEWVARSVGEFRVSSKARINKFIADTRPKTNPSVTSANNYSWVSDDVVYSIGEMMDRLSIEYIKREDFRVNNRAKHMTESCQALSDRVEQYLSAKLVEIHEKGYYECIHEQRTYDLEGIVEELVI